MRVQYSKEFNKFYFRRIKSNSNLTQRTGERIIMFMNDPNNETLKNHRLGGEMKGLFSFSINGDCRIVYNVINGNLVEFIDIGTHNQVYGK